MDFQSRINQFRQGLKDQQDSYNGLASSASQYGRSIIPDKVAQHLTYMEQVGGVITGASAGLHGMVEVGKKINKYRTAKSAKNNPTGNNTQQEDQASKSSKEGQQELSEKEAKGQADDTTQDTSGLDPTAKGKPSQAFAEGQDGGIDAKKLGGEEDDDEEPVSEAKEPSEPSEATEPNLATEPNDLNVGERGTGDNIGRSGVEEDGDNIGRQSTDASASYAKSGAEPATASQPTDLPTIQEQGTEFGEGEGGIGEGADGGQRIGTNFGEGQGSGGNVAPKSDAPTRPSGTAEEGDVDDLANTGSSFTEGADGLMATLKSGASKVGGMVSDASNLVSDASTFVKTGVKDAVSSVVGEVGGEALASSIPIFGELFGLGMLIRSVIEHHKHEENAPPPKLTAPTQEATEQTGGFSNAMLKGSVQAPTIV